MKTSESIARLGAALAKAQGMMEGATKDSKNPHFGSSYADLASVVSACRDALAKSEIAVVQNPAAHDGNLVTMTTLLVHSSGEWIESDPLQVQARDAAPQAIGSCLTYLRRYQLAALVGVAPEDDDAEAAEGRAGAPAKKALPPRAPLPPTARPDPPPSGSGPAKPTPSPKPAVAGRPEPPPFTDKDTPF